jgi:predicted transglutaminase-like cysteine proteinase
MSPAQRAPRRLPTLTVLMTAGLLAGTPMALPPAAGGPLGAGQIFGLSGKEFKNFKPLPQWRTMLERNREEQQKDSRCRQGGRDNCPYTEWSAFIERVRDLEPLTQLREVNRFANRWRYVKDMVNWGVEDYWEVPGEFFERSGDCEDYAIVKFMSLRALGFDNRDILLVAVQDENLDVGHAITLASVNGQAFVLDNQVAQVVPAARIEHYRPVFSANEVSWWLYRPR